jgi:predicted nucleic acid-binding Zn ribbon protein
MPIKDPIKRAECAKRSRKKHYEKNKVAIAAKVQARKRKLRMQFAEYKSKLACLKCGQNHPATLDFHHVVRHPSNRKINELLKRGAINRAMKEIEEKCIVLCSNCHRIHHWNEAKGLE